jgi:hypothetical protein
MAGVDLPPVRPHGFERVLQQPWWLGIDVAVERGKRHGALVPDAEAEADDLGVLPPRGGAASQTMAGVAKVQAVPEQLHGAGLTGEPRRELLQDTSGAGQDAPVCGDGVALVGGMEGVLAERRTLTKVVGKGTDSDLDPYVLERGEQVLVEVGARWTGS